MHLCVFVYVCKKAQQQAPTVSTKVCAAGKESKAGGTAAQPVEQHTNKAAGIGAQEGQQLRSHA